jgi:hypothetical protein
MAMESTIPLAESASGYAIFEEGYHCLFDMLPRLAGSVRRESRICHYETCLVGNLTDWRVLESDGPPGLVCNEARDTPSLIRSHPSAQRPLPLPFKLHLQNQRCIRRTAR